MKHIFLEFNTNVSDKMKNSGLRRIPEIISISVIVLDDNMNFINEFTSLVKPMIYDEVKFIVKKRTGLVSRDLKNKGKILIEALTDLDNFLQSLNDEYTIYAWEKNRYNIFFDNCTIKEIPSTLMFWCLEMEYLQDIIIEKNVIDKESPKLNDMIEYYNIKEKYNIDIKRYVAINDVKYMAYIYKEMMKEDM
jgi:DNA polymerase III epsilon subunit-like protein